MNTARVYPAYSLEIVVSDDQMKHTGRIVADSPGHVGIRGVGREEGSWVRLVLPTESEEHLTDLESRLRGGLGLHLVHCEDRVLARSRGGKTKTRASVPLQTSEDPLRSPTRQAWAACPNFSPILPDASTN